MGLNSKLVPLVYNLTLLSLVNKAREKDHRHHYCTGTTSTSRPITRRTQPRLLVVATARSRQRRDFFKSGMTKRDQNGVEVNNGVNGVSKVKYPEMGCWSESDRPAVVQAAFDFSEGIMASFDGSHDMQHLIRVWRNATAISKATTDLSEEDKLVVDLSCLLHDVDDHKYRKSGQDYLSDFFTTHAKDVTMTVQARIRYLIDHMGYSTEIKYSKEDYAEIVAKEKALPIVQDADRLDAIGAVGIARCFTFGGAKKRALYCEKDIEAAATQVEYPGDCPEMVSAKDGATLMHFFDKLFHLKDKMKTKKGREMAEKRHQVCSLRINEFV